MWLISFVIFITGYSINASVSHNINNQLKKNIKNDNYGFVTNLKIGTTTCEPKYITCYNSTVTFYVQTLNVSCEHHTNFIFTDYRSEQEIYDELNEDYPVYSIHSLKIKEKYGTCTINKKKNQSAKLSAGLVLNMFGYLLTVSIFFGYIYYKINKIIIKDNDTVQNNPSSNTSQHVVEMNELVNTLDSGNNGEVVSSKSTSIHRFDSLVNDESERAIV